MPTAFVTGATGFVGYAVARELLLRGWTVRALARPAADPRNLQELESLHEGAGESGSNGRLERIPGDLRDRESLERGLAGCDALYHVAARYSLWNPRPREIYRDNVDGTRNILEAARQQGVERIVYTSTVGTIHIDGDGTPGDESRTADFNKLGGHYKKSKWLAEQEVVRLVQEGMPITIVHPSAPVGPFDVKPTPTGQMIVDYLNGMVKAYTSTGLNIVTVEDVARGHLLAAERGTGGENYILGSENMSLLEIYEVLGELTEIPPPRVRLPGAALMPIALVSELISRITRRTPLVPWEAVAMASKYMYFDITKAREQLGYEPEPARRALERAVWWFYENNYAKRPPRPGVMERLRESIEKDRRSPDAAS